MHRQIEISIEQEAMTRH